MRKIIIAAVMMGLTGGVYAAQFGDLGVNASDIKTRRAADGNKGYSVDADPAPGMPAVPVEWVSIPGGKFNMGTDDRAKGFEDAKPVHEVSIKGFQMSKTLVTVEQYAECVIQGKCTQPDMIGDCNWGKTDRQAYPVNCVDWDQAVRYAEFKGARLPSEAEWEYAATGAGKNQRYPWGNADATSELAVMNAEGTMPVCSKPAGNTAQGLCDMAGNVWQWTQDKYQDSYNGAPADGGALENAVYASDYEAGICPRVVRGGSFEYGGSYTYHKAGVFRADHRYSIGHGGRPDSVGFRIAK